MEKCIECGEIADAPADQQSSTYPICARCLSENWSTDPDEINEALKNDPELGKHISRPSPLQREDL